MFTRDEQVDMLLVFGECRRNSRNAATVYAERYPNRVHPCATYFYKLEKKFRREDANNDDDFIVSEEAEVNVLAYVHFDPTVSTRQLEKETNVNRESARLILKKHGFRSYKYQIHHHLYENDFNRRLIYCNWFINNYEADNNFHFNILWSDESRFTNLGLFNRNNTRYWATENPHLIREGAFQERFGVNVWLGVIGLRIVGPIFFYEPLDGPHYLQFLQNEVEGFLENLPIAIYDRVMFQQDGAPAHNSRAVIQYLTNRFGERWIGTNGPVRWPARSPDLTILDFFVWAYLKEKVYATPPTTLPNLENRIRTAVNTISEEFLRNGLRETVERAYLCRNNNGGRIEFY
jgi:hypothetical protein